MWLVIILVLRDDASQICLFIVGHIHEGQQDVTVVISSVQCMHFVMDEHMQK